MPEQSTPAASGFGGGGQAVGPPTAAAGPMGMTPPTAAGIPPTAAGIPPTLSATELAAKLLLESSNAFDLVIDQFEFLLHRWDAQQG